MVKGSFVEREVNKLEEDPRPLAEYAGFMAVYNLGLGAYLWRRRNVIDGRVRPWDLLLAGVATYKLSRLIAKDKVTAPIRAPFADYEDEAGPAEVSESPAGKGLRKAIGDIVTCPYCLDQWIATGLAIGFVEAPRRTRFVSGIFSAVAISDFLQVLYKSARDSLE